MTKVTPLHLSPGQATTLLELCRRARPETEHERLVLAQVAEAVERLRPGPVVEALAVLRAHAHRVPERTSVA